MQPIIELSCYEIEKIIALHFSVPVDSVKVFIDDKYPHYTPKATIIVEEKEDSPWIPCTDENANMPEEGDEVLCTLKEDCSYGEGTDIQYHVFEGMYKLTKESCYDMPAANGKGFFEACNDWDEGQPLSVIAWMPKPMPYKE